jgi:trehalose 6-phosphate phosphatase
VTIPALPMTASLARRLSGRPLLVLLDVDGTLSPIAERPEFAIVSPTTRRVVTELARSPDTHVALISGRSARDARRLVGVADVWVIGNHGIEVARPHSDPTVRADIARFEPQLAKAVEECNAIADVAPGVIVEDKHWTLSVHYRLADHSIVPAISAHVARVAEHLGLRITAGKEVLEIRPPVDINKGTAGVELARELHALDAGASIFCAGDDRTDEDTFVDLRIANASAVTVHVASSEAPPTTAAEFVVNNPDEVRTLLEIILEQRRTIHSAN